MLTLSLRGCMALESLRARDVPRMLKVSNERRCWAKMAPITGGQNPRARRKRARSSRACMHVVF